MTATLADAERVLVEHGHRVFPGRGNSFTASIVRGASNVTTAGIGVLDARTFDVEGHVDGSWIVAERRHGGVAVGEPMRFASLDEAVTWLLGA